MEQIKLVQVPVISHELIKIGKNVTSRLDELNITNLVATVDTVKSLKTLRAELNKEVKDFETQRKAVKQGVLSPYKEFEDVYKSEISEKYINAIDLLKDKIATVENKLKDAKKEELTAYFNELCTSENLDFIVFENANISIDLSTTIAKSKGMINVYIDSIISDIELIKSTQYVTEIMTEFKRTLNCSNSITSVNNRKKQEKIEAEKLIVARTNDRQNKCKSIGLIYVDITEAYELNDKFFITKKEIKELSDKDFAVKIAEIETEIKKNKKPTVVAPVATAPIKENSKQETEQEKRVTASFTVNGTMSELKALGQYMKSNNITYKNI